MAEFNRIKAIKCTGNMIEHFAKFKGNKHKYASDFAFLKAYGLLTNEEMSDYLTKNFHSEASHYSGIVDLIPGQIYTNSEIVVTFGVAYMGGMRKSNKNNCLVLIAKHDNPLCDDQWTETGILNYTGMGKNGNQNINFAQNYTLSKLNSNGVKAYLFEAYKDNEYYYDGEVTLAEKPFISQELDEKKTLRTVYKFPLKRVDGGAGAVVDANDAEEAEEQKRKAVCKESATEVAVKAKAAGSATITVKTTQVTQRSRNLYIEEHTKKQSTGCL